MEQDPVVTDESVSLVRYGTEGLWSAEYTAKVYGSNMKRSLIAGVVLGVAHNAYKRWCADQGVLETYPEFRGNNIVFKVRRGAQRDVNP